MTDTTLTVVRWTATENPALSAEQVYEVLTKHQLLPESPVMAAATCNAMSAECRHFKIADESGEVVANVFVSGIADGEEATLDIIPVAKHFRSGFDDPLKEAMRPILNILFNEHRVRRVNACAPFSRSRTKRALCALGFVHEGRKRGGVHLFGCQPEDLRELGLLREEYRGNK